MPKKKRGEMHCSDIGIHIRRMSEARRLTMSMLTERSGLTSAFFGLLKRGKTSPKLKTLLKVCEVLRIDLYHLLLNYAGKPDVSGELSCTLRSFTSKEWGKLERAVRLMQICLAIRQYLEENNSTSKQYKKPDLPLGEHITKLREERELTPQELADKCSLTGAGIRQLQKDKWSPTLDTLSKICNGLGMPLYQLFERYTEQIPEPFRVAVESLPKHEQDQLISLLSLIIEGVPAEISSTEPAATPSE